MFQFKFILNTKKQYSKYNCVKRNNYKKTAIKMFFNFTLCVLLHLHLKRPLQYLWSWPKLGEASSVGSGGGGPRGHRSGGCRQPLARQLRLDVAMNKF